MDKRVIDMTASELESLIAATVRRVMAEQPAQPSTVKGLDGIAAALGVSRSTANRYKRDGRLDGAVWQVGRTIYCDTNLLKTH